MCVGDVAISGKGLIQSCVLFVVWMEHNLNKWINQFLMRQRKAEGGLETEVAYDDIPMQWTKDSREAIRAVPAGFQRRRAKAKIEKTARKLGMTTITIGVCRAR